MPDYPTGWIDDPRECELMVAALERPLFSLAAPEAAGSGEGKTVLLYHAVRQVFGRDLVHRQTVGDCVSHGWALGVDYLSAVEEVMHGERENQTTETATEPLYAYSRVEVGGGKLGGGDGSVGGWAARAVRQGGTLLRKQYRLDGQAADFRRYSGTTAREMGRPRNGVPDWIEPTMAEHPVRQTSLVTDYDEARDAIANGYPVPVCSGQGFSITRDRDGFARPQGTWRHCMLFIGVADEGRPGLLCQNSWGANWNSGPYGHHDIPDGSFWVDADVATRMLRGKDSYAMSSYAGYPIRDTLTDWLVGWS